MTLTTDQFIRRFLSHVLPKGFHRIRHYGLLAMPPPEAGDDQTVDATDEAPASTYPCPACGGRMVIIETFEPNASPRHPRQRAPPMCRSDIS